MLLIFIKLFCVCLILSFELIEYLTTETQKGFLIKINTTAEKQYQITLERQWTKLKGHTNKWSV